MQLRISSAGLSRLGRRSVPQRWLVAMLLTAALLSAAPVQSAAAGGYFGGADGDCTSATLVGREVSLALPGGLQGCRGQVQ